MTDNPNGINPEKDSEEPEREPELLTSRTGRTISVSGLVERIIKEFELEHGEGESDAIKASTSDVERRKLLRDIAGYIFGVESVQLSLQEQARIIAVANAEIFGYGVLDALFADETVSTITLEGTQKIGVRYAPGGELQILEPIFDDSPHMYRIIKRLLRHAGAELHADIPIIETGLSINGRRVSLSVATPPFVPEMAVDIRVHPSQAPTPDDWIDKGILNEKTWQLLEAIIQSEHGFVIVGDTESGKTTLLSMLLQQLDGKGMVSVERASELLLPEGAERLATKWAFDNNAGVTFGEQIRNALEKEAKTIVIDEIRNDEPEAIAPLLKNEDVPRQIWSFRGASESKRLASALGMLARMSDGTQAEYMVNQLYRRLPFMVIIKRRKGKLQLLEVAEWQFPDNKISEDEVTYADYVSLMKIEWEGCEVTGKHPQHPLNLPESFWEK